MLKEVTRLLNADEYGLKSIEEDPEIIAMLNADTLLDSPETASQKIAKSYGKVFLSRPKQFPDRNLISQNPKMFEKSKRPTKIK